MASQPLCEIEIEVPCGPEDRHPVRVGVLGWGKFEVVWSPCDDLLGTFGLMAPCRDWVRNELPQKFREGKRRRLQLIEQLEALGVPAVPPLIEALKDSERDVRSLAASALGEIGTPAVPALIEALKDSDTSVRSRAASALGEIGDARAVPALQQALQTERSANVCSDIQQAIQNIQERNK